ncbi:MAG: hypothetical protein KKE05_04080 [Nanoarchaeota archaeon]|nr:hypothetical protein [Nanoarchaeota archaeon]
MPQVKLFYIGPVIEGDDTRNSLSFLEIQMGAFMTNPDIEIIQTNGPYASHLPPAKEIPKRERVAFTANILYRSKQARNPH